MNAVDELRIHTETLASIVESERKFFAGVAVYARKLHLLVESQPRTDPRPELVLLATKIEEFVARYRPSAGPVAGVFYMQPAHARAADDAVREIRSQLAKISDLPVAPVLALFRREGDEQTNTESPENEMASQNGAAAPTLFISHSHADKEIADALVELLTMALGLKAKQIRCTSRLANGITTGTDADSLRSEVLSARLVIGLVSGFSVQSAWVLFELGARWFQKQKMMPLLVAGALPEELPKPIRDIASISTGDPDQVQKLVEDVRDALGVEAESPLHYAGRLKELVQRSQQAAAARSGAAKVGSGPSRAHTFTDLVHFHFDYSAFIPEDPQGTGRINLKIAPFAAIHSPLKFSLVEYALVQDGGRELVRSKRIIGPHQLVPGGNAAFHLGFNLDKAERQTIETLLGERAVADVALSLIGRVEADTQGEQGWEQLTKNFVLRRF